MTRRQQYLSFAACLVLAAAIAVQAVVLQLPTKPARAQDMTDFSTNYFVTPAETTGITLQAHVAEIRIDETEDGALQAIVGATYRLHNPGNSLEVVGLRVAPGESLPHTRPSGSQKPVMTAGGQPLLLEADGAGGYSVQVQLDADERLTLLLSYGIDLDAVLPTVYYAPSVLNRWPGNVSLRVDVFAPKSVSPESWTKIEPDTWTYALADEPENSHLKWLYDSSIPDLAFVFQFVTPAVWAGIHAGEQATAGGAEAGDYRYLGDLYQTVFMAPQADGAVRDRFYAQALAAYSSALEEAAASPTPQDLVSLHIGLARLYRNRTVEASGISAGQYAESMVQEVDRALSLMAEDDRRRREIMQWRVDGLHVMLHAARNRHDWQSALSILDQLAQMPSDLVDVIAIEEERQDVAIQQALQLLEQGNRDAAFNVARADITGADSSPPGGSLSTYAMWQITVTVRPQTIDITATGVPAPDRHDVALRSALDLKELWQLGVDKPGYAFVVEEVMPNADNGEPVIEVNMQIPVAEGAMVLANLMPAQADWALLRTLLAQLAPTIQRRQGLLWHRVEMGQPLDLSSVGAQWETMAANLERQADEYLAQAESDRGTELSSTGDAALTARIKAARYRAAAQEWRALARDSWLLLSLQLDDTAAGVENGANRSRSWYATVFSPAQGLKFETEMLALGWFAGVSTLILVLVAGLALLLWRLL